MGKLYHKNRVVFGPALVDAFELESKVAKFPRILISRSAMGYIVGNPFVHVDVDGRPFLDYLGCAFSTGRKLSASHGETFSRTRWEYFENFISGGISDLLIST